MASSLSLLLAALAVARAEPAAQLEFDPNFVDLGNLPGTQTTPRPLAQTAGPGGFQSRQFDVNGFSQRPFDTSSRPPPPFDGGRPFDSSSRAPFDRRQFESSSRAPPFDATGRSLGRPPFDVAPGGQYPINGAGGYRGQPGPAGRSFDGPRVPQTLFSDVGQDQINGPSPALPGAPRPAAAYPGERDRYSGPGLNGDAPLLRTLGLGDGPDGLPGPPLPPVPPPNYIPEGELRELLARVDSLTSQQCTHTVAAQWAFETNVNAVTQVSAVSSRAITGCTGAAWGYRSRAMQMVGDG